GANWLAGHWLNGRLGHVGLGDLINAILAEHGLPAADVEQVSGTLAGHVVEGPASARGLIEPLADLFGIVASEHGGTVAFFDERAAPAMAVSPDERVVPDDGPALQA